MRDRYYLLSLLLVTASLAYWLVTFDTTPYAITAADTQPARFDHRIESMLSQRARKAVLGTKVEAATSSSEVELPDPVALSPILSGSVKPSQMTTTASSALVMDEATGDILFSKNSEDLHSIASITKLFTALVFLDYNPGWDKVYQVKKEDRREGGKIFVYAGEKLSVKDLFHLSLVASGNTETLALVNSTGLGEELFVKKMNQKAHALGLYKTYFKDPIGLNEENVSTAEEIAKFAKIALAIPDINQTVKLSKWKFVTKGGRKAVVSSTDEMLGDDLQQCNAKVQGGKTGFNNRAGYCFVGKFANDHQQNLISVVLGETSKQSRFSETEKLIGWAYNNYQWQ